MRRDRDGETRGYKGEDGHCGIGEDADGTERRGEDREDEKEVRRW